MEIMHDECDRRTILVALEQRARTDELTGLSNRRSFDEFIRELPQRTDFPIAVISADCDGLKQINDTLGHLVGDEYIRMSALVFKTTLPEGAQAFRTGGDEFVAFVPEAGLSEANAIVSEMIDKTSRFKLEGGSVSISFGTSVIERVDDNPIDALASADRQMYCSKRRNKPSRS